MKSAAKVRTGSVSMFPFYSKPAHFRLAPLAESEYHRPALGVHFQVQGATMRRELERLVELDREKRIVGHIGALLGWDQETGMPEKADRKSTRLNSSH